MPTVVLMYSHLLPKTGKSVTAKMWYVFPQHSPLVTVVWCFMSQSYTSAFESISNL